MKIGVLTGVQQIQYGTPIFIIAKKEETMRFITYYHRINQQFVINPHTLPRIDETMQKLEGLQYTIALDLNTGH